MSYRLLALLLALSPLLPAQSDLGLFDAHLDVGQPNQPGFASYDAARQTYTIAGAGKNMWFGHLSPTDHRQRRTGPGHETPGRRLLPPRLVARRQNHALHR